MAKAKKESEGTKETKTVVPDMENVMKMVSDLKGENEYLKNVLKDMSAKLNHATEQIKFMTIGEVYKRIDVLWNIITLRGAAEIFGDEFYEECIVDFREIMFPPVEEEKEQK